MTTNLFFGGSSNIAIELAKKIKNVENISRTKSKIYKKNYLLNSYTQKNIEFILSKQIIKILNKFLFKKNITRKFLHM